MRSIARNSKGGGTTFRRGIATQLVGDCQSYCDVQGTATPTWRATLSRSLDNRQWIRGWIINQLSTRGAATCQDTTAIKRAGGWWADAYRGDTFRSGSKLWTLQWSKTINETLQLAKSYAEEALSYLVTWKIASSVVVDVAYINKSVLTLAVTVTGPNVNVTTTLVGQSLPDFGWLWQEQAPL